MNWACKWETPGREPDIHSLALSITTLFLSVFRAPLHTSFTLFRCVPGCLVKTTVQLIESRLTRASVCALGDINQELHTPLQQPSIIPRRRAKKAAMHFCGKWPTAGIVYESESLFGLIRSVKGSCFFSYRAQGRALEGENLYRNTKRQHKCLLKVHVWVNKCMFLATGVETSGVGEAWQLIIRSESGSFRSSITVIHRSGRNTFNIIERHFRWGFTSA